ncbi:hypothetical protein M9H61_07845 [Thalassospira sp. GO-4]|jgi:hypothetical protein|uniref:hypothetical protein n=1 Tax=Thalassospira sp. GO-4 TaxID=2946605 RepID=UPI0020242A76|nr:hypothetical protein [Thalassospira sp. GO-4]URK19401.1 hypothetical protein M9H61_07845 [Thalassospira sp. GO-4]
MATLSEVYMKFGEVSEAAQLLETELGTMLLTHECLDANLTQNPDPEKASEIVDKVNKQTLGRLITTLNKQGRAPRIPSALLEKALDARNFLSHSFYRYHNLRRNSQEGCDIMLNDLLRIHDDILQAYSALMLASGVDLNAHDTGSDSGEFPAAWMKL